MYSVLAGSASGPLFRLGGDYFYCVLDLGFVWNKCYLCIRYRDGAVPHMTLIC